MVVLIDDDDRVTQMQASHTFDWLCLARERDARYTLFAENVRLQQTVQELDGSDQLDRGGGDPVLLRIALDKCRELLSSTQKELLHMKTEYEDCVPRAEHEQLQAAHDELGVRLHALRHDHEHLQARCNRLEESNASVSEELSEVHARCSELERAGTPRPAWADCADFISGGSHRWWQLSDGLSSKDKLRALLKELGPAAETHSLEFFDGLGTDPSVPPYLRHCGPVRNLRLSRRALSVCVAAIWRAKAEQQDTPMQDYLTAYFEERYQQSSTRAEWAYNVCAAAEQALEDLQVKLFWGALHGVISELVYWGLRAQWDRLRDQLDRHSKDQIITMEQFEKLAKTTFPLKSEVEVRNLAEVVRKQLKLALNNTNINLDKLFHEPEEGFSRSELFAELYRQRRAAQDRYLRELMAALPRASTVPRGPRTGDRLVTVEQLKRAFAVVDPAIDHIRMERHIRWAYSLGAAQPLEAPALPLRTLLTRLAAGDIERAGPRSKPTHRRSHYK